MARALVRTLNKDKQNYLINGDMAIAQRSTSISINATDRFSSDRWMCLRNTDSPINTTTSSRVAITDLTGFRYALRYQRNSGNSAVTDLIVLQNIETSMFTPLQGKTVTFSFYARAGANMSGSNLLAARFYTGTGVDESQRSGFTGQTAALLQTVTLTTSWQRFSFSFTVGATATEGAPVFVWTPSGTAGAADYVDITGVMLQEGEGLNDFQLANGKGDIAGELELCKRYYQRNFLDAQGPAISASSCFLYYYLPVTMRVSPTLRQITGTSFTNCIDETGTLARTPTGVTQGIPSTTMIDMSFSGMSGMTIYRPCRLTADVVEASSEII